ncbi:unnamed protein product [Clavelina lepadiformis]|uniref:G-protein coupled receptors family 1 profile domain-containing protein n=1 Tax=Clavelina lepadiformis TaxID=159417 RepID=A0ABP0H2Y5_CLALP
MERNITKDERFFSMEIGNAGSINLSDGFERVPCQQDNAAAGSFEIIASVTGTVIGITNLVVIIVILCGGRKLHKATFFCICNLAFADMLAGLLLLWIFCLQEELLPFRTPISELVQKSIWTVTVWSSMLSQIVIAMDRYCYVTKGTGGMSSRGRRNSDRWGNQKRKRLIRTGIAITWLMPILTYVIPVVTKWNCVNTCFCQVPVNSTSDVFYMVCEPLEECSQINPPFTKGSMLYLGLVLLVMPFIPCVLYAKIYYYVRKSTKNVKPTNNSRPSTSSTCVSTTENELRATPNGVNENNRDHQICSVQSSFGCKSSSPSGDDRKQSTHIYKTSASSDFQSTYWRKKMISARFFRAHAKQQREDGARTQGNTRLGSNGNFSKSIRKALAKNTNKRDMKLLRTLIIILVLFLVSTIPLGLLFLISYGEMDKRYVLTAKILLTASLFNSMVNPWVYFWRFPEMRIAVRRVFCSRLPISTGSIRQSLKKQSSKKKGEQHPQYIEGCESVAAKTTRNMKRSDQSKENSSSSAF